MVSIDSRAILNSSLLASKSILPDKSGSVPTPPSSYVNVKAPESEECERVDVVTR